MDDNLKKTSLKFLEKYDEIELYTNQNEDEIRNIKLAIKNIPAPAVK